MQKVKWWKKIVAAGILAMAVSGVCSFQSKAALTGVTECPETVTLTGSGDSKTITLTNPDSNANPVEVSCVADSRVKVTPASLTIAVGGTGTFTISPNTSAYGTYENAITFTAKDSGTGASSSQAIKVVIAPKGLNVSASSVVASKGGTVQCTATADGNSISGVRWNVAGKSSDSTLIDGNGKLTIGADENATTLTVTATYTYGGSTLSNSVAIGVVSATSDIYTVSVKAEKSSMGTVSGGGAVAKNGNVNIYASANSDCTFKGWYLDGKQVSTSSTYTVTNVTKNLTYEARFIGKEYKIKVKKNINEAGTVSGYKTVSYGDDVTVRVKSVVAGYRFKGWKEGDKYLTHKEELTLDDVKDDHTVVAHFELVDPAAAVQPLSSCMVTLTNEPVNGGTYAGSGLYNPGTDVTITAIPAAGYTFTGWRYNGAIFSNAQSYVLKNISQSYNITAVYTKKASSGGSKAKTPAKDQKTSTKDKNTSTEKETDLKKDGEDSSDSDSETLAEQAKEMTGILAEKNLTEEKAREELNGSGAMALLKEAQAQGYLQIYVKNEMSEEGASDAAIKDMDAPGILNLDAVISGMLTEDEKIKALQGQNVEVDVALSNVSYGISDEEKNSFEEFAGKDLNIATYFDLSLYKTIENDKKAVTQLSNGMVVVLDIPEEFRDTVNEREYFIIRRHVNPDGSVLMSVLEDEDTNLSTITFRTDKFSTYAIAYSGDTVMQAGGNVAIHTDKQYYALFIVIGVMGLVTLITIVFAIVGSREKEEISEQTEDENEG